MGRAIIAGNWKMNLTPSQGVALVKELLPKIEGAGCEVVLCVPFVDIAPVAGALTGSKVRLGAQNLHFKASGAYTGEVSAAMLKEAGAEYVIIGHSERRQYFAESDETVNLKALFALENGLIPIVCVGESLAQRESGETNAFVAGQVRAALQGIGAQAAKGIVLAYEPIWAIGTGRVATNEQANETIGAIRKTLGELYGPETAKGITIQYGGSMNAQNADGLMAMPEIDGGLIGGASLKAEDFAAIVRAASR
jgi:triosephosphate isomerase